MSLANTQKTLKASAAAASSPPPEEGEGTVYIWTDELSKIQFLRTAYKDKEWSATVLDNREPGRAKLHEVEKALKKEGFATERGEEDGVPVLHIRQFGEESRLLDVIQKKGLVAGTRHALKNAGKHIAGWIKGTTNFLMETMKDPARAVGLFYLVGDIALILAGSSHQEEAATSLQGKILQGLQRFVPGREPEEFLKSMSGYAATLQSLIFMTFAREGSDPIRDELLEKIKRSGITLENADFEAIRDTMQQPTHQAWWKRPLQVFKDYPIQTGALAQSLGRTMWGAAGVIGERKMRARIAEETEVLAQLEQQPDTTPEMLAAAKERIETCQKRAEGFHGDQWTALFSIAGWGFLAYQGEGLIPSAILTGASLQSIHSGITQGNKQQVFGESAYVFGDLAIALTKTEDYGKGASALAGYLGEAAAKFMQHLPFALSEPQRQRLIADMAASMASESMPKEEPLRKEESKTTEPAEKPLSKEEFTQLIIRNASEHARNFPDRFAHLCDHAARVVALLPTEKRQEAASTLSKYLCESSPGILADVPDVETQISKRLKLHAHQHERNGNGLDTLQHAIADLLEHIPGNTKPSNALALYDILVPPRRQALAEVATGSREHGKG